MYCIKFYVIFLFIVKTNQINILRDDENEGLVFQMDRYIHHQVSEIQLNFMINVTIMNTVRTNLSTLCRGNRNEMKFFERTLEKTEITWNIETNEILPENYIEIENPRLIKLRQSLSTLPHVVCNNIKYITRNFYKLLDEFEKLRGLNINDIFYSIPIEKIRAGVFAAVQAKPSFKYAFENDTMFLTYLIRQMETEFHYSNEKIYFILRLPLFDKKQYILHRVYSKPIINGGDAYLYKNELKYALTTENRVLRFGQSDYKIYCFSAVGNFFCREFKRPKNTCDDQYLDKLFLNQSLYFNDTCFDRLKNNNMITQVNGQIYFLLFSPMDIEVKIGRTHFSTRIYESSKIIEYIDYELRTSFFNFSPRETWKYQIYTSPVDESYALKFSFYSHKTLNMLKLTIYLVVIYTLVFISKLCGFFYKKYKRNQANYDMQPATLMTEL